MKLSRLSKQVWKRSRGAERRSSSFCLPAAFDDGRRRRRRRRVSRERVGYRRTKYRLVRWNRRETLGGSFPITTHEVSYITFYSSFGNDYSRARMRGAVGENFLRHHQEGCRRFEKDDYASGRRLHPWQRFGIDGAKVLLIF